MGLPERTQRYNGFITEALRWESFRHRHDDIFVCTPPKCGTTWTQAICAMLVFGRADIDVEPGNISPWIDANFVPAEVVNAMLEAQTHRRFIKTHTPLDGIPFYPECTYLAVYRDPHDTFFSMISHLENMTDERVKARIPVEVHTGFQTEAVNGERSVQQKRNGRVRHRCPDRCWHCSRHPSKNRNRLTADRGRRHC